MLKWVLRVGIFLVLVILFLIIRLLLFTCLYSIKRSDDFESYEEQGRVNHSEKRRSREKLGKMSLFDRLFLQKQLRQEAFFDKAQFHALAPTVLPKDEFSLIKIVMLNEGDASRLERVRKSMRTRVKENSSGIVFAKRMANYTIVLSSQDIDIEDSEESITWNGVFASCDFEIFIPKEYSKTSVRIHARIYEKGVPLVDLKLIVKVEAGEGQETQNILAEQHKIMSAFLSYASEDREEVAQRIQGMLAVRPDLDIFWDVISLLRGENWEPRIYNEISNRDIFYLFWSNNARKSEWVGKELQYAIEVKSQNEIEPIPLEDPEECPPPEALSSKHFNDWVLRYIKGKELKKQK